MTAPDPDSRLERSIDRLLRDQPLRRAPPGLAVRVMKHIEREARPWWRKDFSRWPAAARIGVLAASVASGVVAWMVGVWMDAELELASTRVAEAPPITTLRALRAAVDALTHPIPTDWFYLGIAVLVAMYLSFFGLGAAAYRTLYVPR
jgi:hypothetical protein